MQTSMNSDKSKQNVFICGSKSIGLYGGYETFVYRLTDAYKDDSEVKYIVACKSNGTGCMDMTRLHSDDGEHYFYNNTECILVRVPEWMGSAQAIYYDLVSVIKSYKYIKNREIKNATVYILACRIGPFAGILFGLIRRRGGRVFINPDGHEWKRQKWSYPIRKYWKLSERLMVKHSDLIICDSKNIEKYIIEEYKKYHPNTTYIAYGADYSPSVIGNESEVYTKWLRNHHLENKEYYLCVGRFVPENNYEVMIREYMRSHTNKILVIVTTENKSYMHKLNEKLGFDKDNRIRFVGTVYDAELLKKIRENAYGYLHGHSVGGTNPSLLEALGSTKVNLLYDVGFNREVAEDAALYWTDKEYDLAKLIDKVDELSSDEAERLGKSAKERIKDFYTWKKITDEYITVFGG